MQRKTMTLPVLAVMAAAALTACGERHDEQAARTNDSVVARADQAGRDAVRDTGNAAGRAGDSIKEAGRDVKDATVAAANTAGDKVQDAVITTSVNAEL